MAKEAAPGYTVANEIGVRPIGTESQAKSVDSNLDDGIENNYKAAIKAHKNLDDQSIHYDAKNGTLMLKGSVKTAAQKKEAAHAGQEHAQREGSRRRDRSKAWQELYRSIVSRLD